MQAYSLKLTFTTPVLGSAPLNEAVYSTFIASKAPAHVNGNHEVATLPTVEDIDLKGRTGFHRDELGRPLLLDYVVRGYCKEAWRALRQMRGTHSADLKTGVSAIDKFLFVFGVGNHRDRRYIVLNLVGGRQETVYERPLRAQTAQGPRVALAASEMLPEGTKADIKLEVLAPHIITQPLLEEWFAYGKYSGLGQFRGGSFGRFEYRLTPWQ